MIPMDAATAKTDLAFKFPFVSFKGVKASAIPWQAVLISCPILKFFVSCFNVLKKSLIDLLIDEKRNAAREVNNADKLVRFKSFAKFSPIVFSNGFAQFQKDLRESFTLSRFTFMELKN